ncbi:MAG: transposase [Devosia sp.]|uniref:IS110 family transposase n=1 Tax=Devosia sp. TaxID=1871048 RepID=UPI00260F7B1C|nr:IS110 family transposase [Devosia sp.]MDB5542756.1 transposase [Devosia sp.]
MHIATVGLDIAKHVFQVHAVDADGTVVIRKRYSRAQLMEFFEELPSCLVGIEACGTAHYWGRQLQALGHDVRLMPAHYVKPYVKRGKNDAADAEGICEAVTRPTMRFVPIKAPDTQALALMHRLRTQFVGQRTGMLNALRAGMAEFGIVTNQGLGGATEILRIACAGDERLPAMIRDAYKLLADAIRAVEARLVILDHQISASTQFDDTCKRLSTIPGVGPVTSTTIIALAGDVSRFPSGRDFAAWLGLTPRQNSTGGKARLGRITKAGDQTLRTLLVLGAFSVIKRARVAPEKASRWLMALMERRPPLVAAVALANKMARIIWAILTRGGTFRTPARAA